MRRMPLFVVALGLALVFGVPQAKATDPCDPGVFADMSKSAQAGFNRLSDIAATLLKPPAPAASSDCMRNLFDIWGIDPSLLVASLFPTGTLGYTVGGFTLTHSSPAAIVLSTIQSLLADKFGTMICKELWNNIGEALRPITFLNDGGIEVGVAVAPAFSGIPYLSQFFTLSGLTLKGPFDFGGFSGGVNFDSAIKGTITIKK